MSTPIPDQPPSEDWIAVAQAKTRIVASQMAAAVELAESQAPELDLDKVREPYLKLIASVYGEECPTGESVGRTR